MLICLCTKSVVLMQPKLSLLDFIALALHIFTSIVCYNERTFLSTFMQQFVYNKIAE